MAQQRDLFERPPLRVTPESGRSEPRLWIRRLVLWRAPGDVIREFRLRPGLNIVWSPDPADSGQRRSTSLGHGAGKTLFCRLLRYVLGEDRFADEQLRQRIAHALENGLVGAEVIVAGASWSVVRPLGRTRRHLALRDVPLDELPASNLPAAGIEPLLDAIEQEVLSPAVAELIDARPGAAWRTALAWLTRDQECRFDHHLDWRRKESGSDSPALNADRLAAVRALIGAIVPDELNLERETEMLRNQLAAAKRGFADRERELERLRVRLLRGLQLSNDSVPGGPAGITIMFEAAKRRIANVAGVRPDTDLTDVSRIRDRYDATIRATTRLSVELKGLASGIDSAQTQIDRIRAELPGLKLELKMGEKALCPVCRVPIDDVLAEGCKIVLDHSKLETTRKRYENGERELALHTEALNRNGERKITLEMELRDAESAASDLRAVLRAAETAQTDHANSWYEARALFDRVREYEQLVTERDEEAEGRASLERHIDDRSGRLAAFRDQQATVFARLSRFFKAIIAKLVPGATGKIELDGNGIHLSVELDGDRSTAAMTSLKVVAFDLAVMCMSIEGGVRLPAFLVHDSPREADMGLSLYRELFATIQELEPEEGTPLFQYIVTTTTSPPPAFTKKPWLLETLHGTPADARLLKCNL